MDNSILVLDTSVADVSVSQAKNTPSNSTGEQGAFGEVLDNQLQKEESKAAVSKAAEVNTTDTRITGTKAAETKAAGTKTDEAVATEMPTVTTKVTELQVPEEQVLAAALISSTGEPAIQQAPLAPGISVAASALLTGNSDSQGNSVLIGGNQAGANPPAASVIEAHMPIINNAQSHNPGVPAAVVQTPEPGAPVTANLATTAADAEIVTTESAKLVVPGATLDAQPKPPLQTIPQLRSRAAREQATTVREQGAATVGAMSQKITAGTGAINAVEVGGKAAQSGQQAVAAGIEQAATESLARSFSATAAHSGASTHNTMSAPGIALTAQPASAPASAASLAPAAPQPLSALTQPMGDGQWNQAFGQRVVWAVGQGIQTASLAMHPEELGPVTIQIAVKDDVAQLNFNAAHGLTRDAIEAALPRLREMLQASGIDLGQVNISGDQGARAGHEGSQQQGEESATDLNHQGEDESALVSSVTQYTSHGLVDTFV